MTSVWWCSATSRCTPTPARAPHWRGRIQKCAFTTIEPLQWPKIPIGTSMQTPRMVVSLQVMDILQQSGNVVAAFAGHTHQASIVWIPMLHCCAAMTR
jgi:hypothetical protein